MLAAQYVQHGNNDQWTWTDQLCRERTLSIQKTDIWSISDVLDEQPPNYNLPAKYTNGHAAYHRLSECRYATHCSTNSMLTHNFTFNATFKLTQSYRQTILIHVYLLWRFNILHGHTRYKFSRNARQTVCGSVWIQSALCFKHVILRNKNIQDY